MAVLLLLLIISIQKNKYANNATYMFVLYYRSRTMTVYTTTYNHEMRCCPGYGPKPNCLRKLYLLLMYTKYYGFHKTYM